MESTAVILSRKDEQSEPQLPKPKRVMVKTDSGYEEQILLPLVSDLLPKEFKAMAAIEFNETEENRTEGLQKLREFIKREKLPYCMDDELLLSFLRYRKFDIRRAEEKLRQFSHTNQMLMEFVASLDVSKVRAILENRIVSLLPYRDQMGRTIIYTRGCGWRPDLFSLEDANRCLIALTIFSASFPMTSVCGFCYIMGCKMNSTYDLYHVATEFKKSFPRLLTIPFRIKRVDSVNEYPLIRFLINLNRSLASPKIFQRLFMHGKNLKSLHKIYHPSTLPPEFGGTLEPSEEEIWKEKFFEFLQKIKLDFENYRKENTAKCS